MLAKGQCPTINVTLQNPTTNTANWGMGTSIFQITVTGSAKAMETLNESQVLVTIKDGNGIVCRGNKMQADITGQTAVKTWSGSGANALLGQNECTLKPGTYTICVEFYGNKYVNQQIQRDALLCDNRCATVFTISDACSPPLNINPVNKKIFTDQDILKPISFNWTPVMAGSRSTVIYRLFVWEVEEGQTNAMAMYNNSPVIQEDIKGQTRFTVRPGFFEKRDADYVWRVIAIDEKDQPICRTAQSEATNFSVRIPEKKQVQKDSLNTPCGNGDFESGILDPIEWSAGYTKLSGGNNSTFSPPFNNIMQPANGNPIDAPINAGCGNQANENHHVIVSVGFDPMVPTLPRVPASTISNKYALRLGNNCPGCGTERIQKKFVVTTANTSYKFMYALVVQAPHGLTDNPSLWVRVFNSSGVAIPGLVYLDPQNTSPMDRAVSDLTNPYWKIFKKDANSENDVLYREWACARIDLSNLVGQVVTVEILTNDCAQCGHYGYAYVDNFCIGCDNNPPPSDCCTELINAVSDKTTVTPGSNYVNIQQEYNVSPTNIKYISAEIISVDEDPIDTACMQCGPKDKWAYQFISHNTTSWNSATPMNGSPVNSTAYYPAHRVEWHCNKQGNLKFSLKIALPGNAAGCQRKTKICIRYRFTDVDCKTCERIVCYQVNYK